MAKKKIEARVRFGKLFNDNETMYVIIENRSAGGDWGLDKAYPIKDKMISADIFNELASYQYMGINIDFDL